MLENSIIYTVEVIKYYIIMKYLLGFKVRRNLPLSVIGAIVIGVFSAYVTVTENNPMVMFLVYIFIEMFILIKEKISIIVLSTCWLMIIVGMLDSMFLVVIKFIMYNAGATYSILNCAASVVTMIFLIVLVLIIRKRTHSQYFRISKIYYIYFSLLTLAESALIEIMENVLEEKFGTKMLLFILMCTIIMVINIVIVLVLAVSNDGYKQRDEINRIFLKNQEENYLYLKERNEDIRKFRHDMKAHMLTMSKLVEKEENEQLKEYINRVVESVHLDDKRVSVANGVVDAILNKYWYDAEKYGISMSVKGELFEDCNIEPYDLCVIFDNIIKNAIEAAVDTTEKYVYINVNRNKEHIQIYVENSCNGNLNKVGGEYITTKKDNGNHGYGLKNVSESVKKYKGTISKYVEEDEMFCIDIFIPILK